MTDRDALYAAIMAEPPADAPRLVYADWLEEFSTLETDRARAAFIRLEIAAESAPHDSLERAELERSAAELYSRHCDTWNAEIADWGKWYESSLVYRRGFPDELRPHYRRFVVGIDDLLNQVPLQVLDLRSVVQPLFATGLFASNTDHLRFDYIHTIRLGRGVTNLVPNDILGVRTGPRPILTQLLTHPRMKRLTRLEVSQCDLNSKSVTKFLQALAKCPTNETIVELDLSDNRIEDAGGMFLASARELDTVRDLDLRGNLISAKVCAALAERFGQGLRI